MSDKPESHGLLQMLNNLFSRISLLDLEKRKQSYRPHTGAQHDISERLSRHIDSIVASHVAKPPASVKDDERPEAEPASVPAHKQPVTAPSSSGTTISEVSDYFKSKASSADSAGYLGDKMVSSTWTHIHSALLYAHQGDATKAKLHMDIANQALKEAAHYMNDDEYNQFVEEVEKALALLDQQKH